MMRLMMMMRLRMTMLRRLRMMLFNFYDCFIIQHSKF
jgi:hypothetical protein